MTRKLLLFPFLVLILGLTLAAPVSAEEKSASGERLLKNFNEAAPGSPLLPAGVEVKPGFASGPGSSVGKVQMAQGQVFIVHKGQSVAYIAKKDAPLYVGDTIVSSSRSRLSALMNDHSVLALAPSSKLVIDNSSYTLKDDSRSSAMSLLFGQVRFIVKKLSGHSNFTVNTKTAVCGVRGTDFAVSLVPSGETAAAAGDPLITTVVTGADSTVSMAGSVGEAVLVGPTSVAAAAAGSAVTAPAFVGAAATAALGLVGPGLASMSMPPGFN